MDAYTIFAYTLVIFLTLFILIVFVVNSIKRNKEYREIIETTTPKEFILEDVIIIKQFGYHVSPKDNDKIVKFGRDNDLIYRIIPLLRDVQTNELLISFGDDFYGSYKYYYQALVFSNRVDWNIKNNDGVEVNVGDTGIYRLKEYVNHDIQIDNNIIYLDGIKYKYMGNIEDSRPLSEIGNCLLFNVNNGITIQNVSQIKFFKGCIDFDEK